MARYLKSTETIRFEVDGAVAVITLNRPDRHNTIGAKMVGELEQAFMEADALTTVNVVLLQGAGRSFCAGYDLGDSYGGGGTQEENYRSINATMDDDCWNLEQTQRKLAIIGQMHKPVIAKLHGNCLAGGTDLAFACDLVIASETCKIGFPATRANGTPPSNMWMYHCGPQWAKRLLFTGDSVLGRDAARIGLILDCYPEAELDAEALALAKRVALVDGELLATHKRAINLALELQGAHTLQRLVAELDARAHLTRGPRRSRFRSDAGGGDIRTALQNRDADFGKDPVRIRWTESS